MNDKVKYWLDTAQYDLETAQAMLDTGRYLYVGFTCHLTTEKALKAAIANLDKFPPKIHNLTELAKMSELWKDMGEEQRQLLRELNPLNIAGRYPSYKSKIEGLLTKTYCQQLIIRTKEMFSWIEGKLSEIQEDTPKE